ncbi:MAG: ATP-binding cassette domain-containing protein [Ruminococcus sp.]|nr:ATP-binding cassette domain-containing protein [Ruminococcus sp.]
MALIVDIKKKLGNFSLNVSFETNSKSTALFGLSGSGKSVTLKCIAGVMNPDSGKIIIDGVTVFDSEKRINLPPQKREIGYVPQNYALFPDMTVAENISCVLKNMKKSEKTNVVEAYLNTFDLADVKYLYPHQLSGGQAQRVALARALVLKPKLLLLDEPFSSLDEQIKTQLELNLINTINSYDGKVLLVSHNKHEVYKFCDNICVVDNGFAESCIYTQSIFKNPSTKIQAVLVGIDNVCDVICEQKDMFITSFGIKVPKKSGYKSVAFYPDAISLMNEQTDSSCKAKIVSKICDINKFFIFVQRNNNSTPIKVEVSKNKYEQFDVGNTVCLNLEHSKLFYLK